MAKAKKVSLPKKVAGVKIPKAVRTNKTLVRLAQNPRLAELAAAGLVAAVGTAALMGKPTVKKTAKAVKAKVSEAVNVQGSAPKVREKSKGK